MLLTGSSLILIHNIGIDTDVLAQIRWKSFLWHHLFTADVDSIKTTLCSSSLSLDWWEQLIVMLLLGDYILLRVWPFHGLKLEYVVFITESGLHNSPAEMRQRLLHRSRMFGHPGLIALENFIFGLRCSLFSIEICLRLLDSSIKLVGPCRLNDLTTSYRALPLRLQRTKLGHAAFSVRLITLVVHISKKVYRIYWSGRR